MDYSGFYLSSYAHRDYGYAIVPMSIAIVPMYYIVFIIHRDAGKCRRLDVCCRQAQINIQRCFAAILSKKEHTLASELAGVLCIPLIEGKQAADGSPLSLDVCCRQIRR